MSTRHIQTERLTTAAPTEPGPARPGKRKRGHGVRIAVLVTAVVVVGGLSVGILGGRGSAEGLDSVPIAEVKQGPLKVLIEEKGAIFDMKPLEILDEVEGWSTVLEVVDQGTIITQEDVDNGLVLVKFDTSQLEEQENDRTISVYNAEASYTQAKEDLDIQIKQNESDVAEAELAVRFARLDLDKYLGADLAAVVIEKGLAAIDMRQLALEETQLILGEELSRETLGEAAAGPISEGRVPLGGEARQELRDLSSAVQLAKLDLTKAQNTLKYSKDLAREEYISRSALVTDQLSAERLSVALDSAREELRLFRQFVLPREAERLYSDCSESRRDLERVAARTRSQLAQKEASLKSRERGLALEKERLEKVRKSLQKAVIRAPKPGTVVYGSNQDTGHEDPISEGSSIQEGKVILRIPDVKSLSVRVNINEKFKDVVKPGLSAFISVEALPGKLLQGRVTRISPMASTTQAWLNPDEKVYETEIMLLTPPSRFIPGMSATAQIVVADLEDAIYVPVQAVINQSGVQVCWVKSPEGPEPRLVQTGYLAGKYLQVTAGLRAGEKVYLAPPEERDEDKLVELVAQAEQSRQQGREGGPGGLAPGAEGGEPGGAGEAAEPAGAAGGEPPAASVYMDGDNPDWAKIGEAMQGLEGDERGKKWEEILSTLPADARTQLEEAARRWQGGGDAGAGDAGAGGRGGGRRGGGGGGRRGGGRGGGGGGGGGRPGGQ
jgi:HlyD family secretion protein